MSRRRWRTSIVTSTALAAPALIAAVLAVSAVAVAAPEDRVNRDRLKKATLLPSVGPRGWYYVTDFDGRVWEGGDEPSRLDAAALRARIDAASPDALPWLDLASAHRRANEKDQEKQALDRALELLRRRVAEQQGDGQALASLGLALLAAGDDAGADKAIADARKAERGAWAGDAAFADVLVARAIAKTAGRRFASLDDAMKWASPDGDHAVALDTAALDAAEKPYGDAVAALEKSGASGTSAGSVHLRRNRWLLLRDACAAPDEPQDVGDRRLAVAASDYRKALDLQPSNPDAVTLLALDDASGADEDGRVRSFQDLSEAARSDYKAHLARLRELSKSPDAGTAARALHGIACLQWFVQKEPASAVGTLRQSIARDPRLQPSWNALVHILSAGQRWDDIAKLCTEWLETRDSARTRMMLGKALSQAGHDDEAEKHFRAALALDPKSADANLGVAVLVIRRTEGGTQLDETRTLLRAASAALPPKGDDERNLRGVYRLADAITSALSGELDSAEKKARALLDDFGEFPQAREVLAAIGR